MNFKNLILFILIGIVCSVSVVSAADINDSMETGFNNDPVVDDLETDLINNDLETELNNDDLTKNSATLENSTLKNEDVKSNSSTVDKDSFLHDMCKDVRNKNMSFSQFSLTYSNNIADLFNVTSKDLPATMNTIYYYVSVAENIQMTYITTILKNPSLAHLVTDFQEVTKQKENPVVEKNEKKDISESDYWDAYMKSLDPFRYSDLDDYFDLYKRSLHRLYLSHDYGKDFNMYTTYYLGYYGDDATRLGFHGSLQWGNGGESIVGLDGCGHKIDGNGEKRGLYVFKNGRSLNVVNTNFINGYSNLPFKNLPNTPSGKGFGGAAVIDGVHLDKIYIGFENCNFTNNWAGTHGGAIFQGIGCENPTLHFKNCKFINNTAADGNGGAIYTEGKVILENCIFDSNTAKGKGGAVYAANVELKNCTFINNIANEGGAIYAYDDHGTGNVIINQDQINNPLSTINPYNTFFINNKAKDDNGGAIYAEGTVTTVNALYKGNQAYVDGGAIYSKKDVSTRHSAFESNKADGAKCARCWGGAIRAEGNVKVDLSSFTDNFAENSGGAIYADTISFANTKSIFKGNTAYKAAGGAIYVNKFETGVYGIEFIDNKAGVVSSDDGGAIYINKKGDYTFFNCIFEKNSCSCDGGAIYLDSKDAHLTLTNNIFEGNTAKEGQSVYNKGYYDTIRNNYWGINPTKDNDQVIEWRAVLKNVHHTDSSPMASKPVITISGPVIKGPVIKAPVIKGPKINVPKFDLSKIPNTNIIF